MNRTVSTILPAPLMNMGDIQVRQPFPARSVDQIDPFLLLHHGDIVIPESQDLRHAGVGPHPHRGFSPVTFVFSGGVRHRDSRMNDSVVYAGGTQWMNAGMGVMHSERPAADIHERGGRMEIIQLWVNTPAAHKMDQPEYHPLSAGDTPTLLSDDGRVTVGVVSGSMLGLEGPIPTPTSVNAVRIEMRAGGSMYFPIPRPHNAFLYLLDGRLNIGEYGPVDGLQAVVLAGDGDGVGIQALEDTRVVLLSGQPIHEPVVSHGPFVMNTHTQILEAIRDYRMGKMGILVED